MRVEDLRPEVMEYLKAVFYDVLIEKHEGGRWEYDLKFERWSHSPKLPPNPAQFMQVGGRWVLLPVGRSHHPKITILQVALSTCYLADWSMARDAGCAMAIVNARKRAGRDGHQGRGLTAGCYGHGVVAWRCKGRWPAGSDRSEARRDGHQVHGAKQHRMVQGAGKRAPGGA